MAEAEAKLKRPASQYYWGDWWKDKGLHSCCLTARGLWHEMNCLMHEGEPYGHLTLNGKPMTVAQLANQCRITAGKCKALMDELEVAGVFSRHPELGTIFSRRMVRDEATREARAQAGRENGVKGKDFGALGGSHGSKGGRPRKEETPGEPPGSEPGEKPPQNPHPSSSSSSSSSPSGKEEEPADAGLSPAAPTPPPSPPSPLSLVGEEPEEEPLPPCPHRRLIALFVQKLPELPKPRAELWMNGQGADDMRQRWKWLLTATREDGSRYATTMEEGVQWFAAFFEQVAASDFLTGRDGKWNDCSLAWLMKRQKFTNIVEGQYQKDRRVA